MHRNKSVNQHQFAMVPKAEIPRSQFIREFTHKTTFDAGYLIPVYVDEVLPGDTFNMSVTMFARMATPLYPIMDNLYLDSFFFFVPARLVWTNFVKFMGQQDNPGDSIVYTVPVLSGSVGGYAVGSIFDYMGLPTVGQVAGGAHVDHNVLPLRCYNKIYNDWFRDENLQNSVTVTMADSGDAVGDFTLLRRGKRHDYFTSCLPWTQKGTAVAMPIYSSYAPVRTMGTTQVTGVQSDLKFSKTADGTAATVSRTLGIGASGNFGDSTTAFTLSEALYPNNLAADLSTATNFTINALRQSFAIQKLLERDARGGTRYVELIRQHFGVFPAGGDARLQRAEYLGGGSTPINISPIVQNTATGLTGGSTPLGTLAAIGTTVGNGGFSASFTEHGYIIGLVAVRADLTYQQGLHRMWSRSTRYDFYFPAFAMLGEQAVLNKEIYCDGSANDGNVFGYQERWACYRYKPSQISGLFKSTSAGTIDGWHLAQKFTALPTLNTTFIQDTPPLSRVLAVGASANGQQFIFDSFWHNKVARPMPLYSVPGLIDHF